MSRVLIFLVAPGLFAQPPQASDFHVTVLSTQTADPRGIGEWGFSALIASGGKRILFDTGNRPDTVAINIAELEVDLSTVEDVILSHSHGDHTGGLLTLRKQAMAKNPKALGRLWVAKGFAYPRLSGNGDGNPGAGLLAAYRATGGEVIEVDNFRAVVPGLWLTGPVPRKHPERNWSGSGRIRLPDGTTAEDNLPEDMALIANTSRGIVIVTGCGHAGIVNIAEHARAQVASTRVEAIIGGIHLFPASDETVAWTAARLKDQGLRVFMGAHCTGVEALYRIRSLAGLTCANSSTGAVGARYSIEKGLEAGTIAR
jgi:7,8-dihydropterin-6-yl-methyl-4-(beta-D-ribofuranosyl)aminobenzene 5'-phosphate synthase